MQLGIREILNHVEHKEQLTAAQINKIEEMIAAGTSDIWIIKSVRTWLCEHNEYNSLNEDTLECLACGKQF